MQIYVVWLDRDHAKIFQFSENRMERSHVHARHVDHHTHQLDHLDEKRWERRFYSDLANRLADGTKVLLLGPGVAKHHFQTYLFEQVPALGKRLVGCENVDHPTDAQIADLARRYFRMDSTA